MEKKLAEARAKRLDESHCFIAGRPRNGVLPLIGDAERDMRCGCWNVDSVALWLEKK